MNILPNGKAELDGAETVVLVLRMEAEIRNKEPWFAALDQAKRYRLIASALRKITGATECTILNLFGAVDDPTDGDRLVPSIRLVYDAARKAA